MVARAPRKRMYRTMQGRMVDIEKLRAANETVQAVGNMNVNARGDVIGPGGQIVTPKEQVVAKYYEAPKGMVDDTPVRNKPTPAEPVVEQPKQPEPRVMTPIPPKAEPKKIVKPEAPKKETVVEPEGKKVDTFKPKTTTTAKSGIDAALDGLE